MFTNEGVKIKFLIAKMRSDFKMEEKSALDAAEEEK